MLTNSRLIINRALVSTFRRRFASSSSSSSTTPATESKSNELNSTSEITEYIEQALRLDLQRIQKRDKQEEPSKKTCSPENKSSAAKDADYHKMFKLLSWNIDGLDRETNNLGHRTRGVINKITTELPDVVFLQEVIKESDSLLRDSLSTLYEFSTGYSGCEYYTLVLTRKSKCQVNSTNINKFSNTKKGRNLLQVKLRNKNQVNMCGAMTSHLEGPVPSRLVKQRVQQLRKCFEEMDKVEPDWVVGDMKNLGDSELKGIGGLPGQVCDVWQATEARQKSLYTVDMLHNTNVTWKGKSESRCRFDRLYYRPPKNGTSKVLDPYLKLLPSSKTTNYQQTAKSKQTPRPVAIREQIKRPIIIDGSNVAVRTTVNGSEFMSNRIKMAINFFVQRGHDVVIAIVPKFRGNESTAFLSTNKTPTRDVAVLSELHKQGRVTYSPGQVHDDREILDQAIALGAVVVSNDRYKEFEQDEKYAEFFKNRQYNTLQFTVHCKLFNVSDEPHGQNGPKLDDILNYLKPKNQSTTDQQVITAKEQPVPEKSPNNGFFDTSLEMKHLSLYWQK